MVAKIRVRILDEREVGDQLTEICQHRFLWRISPPNDSALYWKIQRVASPRTITFFGKNAEKHRLLFKLAYQEPPAYKSTDGAAYYAPYIPLMQGTGSGKSCTSVISSPPPKSPVVVDLEARVDDLRFRHLPEVRNLHPAVRDGLAGGTLRSPFAIAIAASELQSEESK